MNPIFDIMSELLQSVKNETRWNLTRRITTILLVASAMSLLPIDFGSMAHARSGTSDGTKPQSLQARQSEGCSEPEQTVDIPDPALDTAVRQELDEVSGVISCSEIQRLTYLNALYVTRSSPRIRSLEGLQFASNLNELYLVANSVRDLSPLAGLAGLTKLALGTNQISNLAPINDLDNLTVLGLAHNQISNVSPLGSLTNLTVLNLGGNMVRTISSLRNLTKLATLHLRGNRISNLAPLVNNPGVAEGDYVDIRKNCLNLDPDSDARAAIKSLAEKGVEVMYQPQSDCTF